MNWEIYTPYTSIARMLLHMHGKFTKRKFQAVSTIYRGKAVFTVTFYLFYRIVTMIGYCVGLFIDFLITSKSQTVCYYFLLIYQKSDNLEIQNGMIWSCPNIYIVLINIQVTCSSIVLLIFRLIWLEALNREIFFFTFIFIRKVDMELIVFT